MIRNIRGIIGCIFIIMFLNLANAENFVCVDDYSNERLGDLITSIEGTKVLDYSGEGDCEVVLRYNFGFNEEATNREDNKNKGNNIFLLTKFLFSSIWSSSLSLL